MQARSFGALLAAIVVDRDNVTGQAGDEVVGQLLDAVVRWYVAEPDPRGFDERLGWRRPLGSTARVWSGCSTRW